MKRVTIRDLHWLIGPQAPPCLSVYLTLDAEWPGGPEDCRRLNALLEEAARRLSASHSRDEVNALLKPMVRALERGWPPRARSLALLRSHEVNLAFELPFEVPPLAIVADAFHTKPLLRDADRSRFFVLRLLDGGGAELLEGTPSALSEVEPSRTPRALRAALAGEVREGEVAGRPLRLVTGAGREGEARLRRRFRALDEALCAFLDDRGTPLVLAGVAEHHAPFRAVSAYPHLLDDGIEEEVADLEALHARAWGVVRAHHEEVEQLAASQFVSASLRGEASDRLDEIAAAAADGRVGLLLHREGAHVPGRVDPRSGACALAPGREAQAGADVIDALCDLTLLRGGDVVEVHPSRMPSDSPIAAVFWS